MASNSDATATVCAWRSRRFQPALPATRRQWACSVSLKRIAGIVRISIKVPDVLHAAPTWSGVAMHEGMLPGFAASHGCIRMPKAFCVEAVGDDKLGVRVVVAS